MFKLVLYSLFTTSPLLLMLFFLVIFLLVIFLPYSFFFFFSYIQGYSVGALARTVRAIVTRRRVMMLRQRPLSTTDFIDNLSLQDVTYKDDKLVQ